MSPPAAPRRVWAIVPAAGRGERFASSIPKQYAPLLGRSVIEWALRSLLGESRIEGVVVALAAADPWWPAMAAKIADARLLTTEGGANRQSSVLRGLARLESRAAGQDWVMVHDAARPCLSAAEIAALLAALDAGAPGAVLAVPLVDTIRRERDGHTVETVDRRGLWRALTPQVFAYGALRAALESAEAAGASVTDEAQAMERVGVNARLVEGSAFNIKVTNPQDLPAAARILRGNGATAMRIGQGFDVHTFGEGSHVVLGGVSIPHSHGVVAHSDGDVVIHALCDALLGALGQGDIGQHFPDTDARYRGADSRVFLRAVAAMLKAAGLRVVNADVTVLAEAPRIAKHRLAMARNLAEDLDTSADRINIKATTTERLGFVGRGEGLAASAAVLIDS
jgi:2-C-methyl-D-erythritol 4-phosphate cytidylyltransferase/2-C-methyl-D-erythritol 2,4-cyclodiphosphate synthase